MDADRAARGPGRRPPRFLRRGHSRPVRRPGLFRPSGGTEINPRAVIRPDEAMKFPAVTAVEEHMAWACYLAGAVAIAAVSLWLLSALDIALELLFSSE